jgi:CBS domain-containing protein
VSSVRHILAEKGAGFCFVSPEATVLEAVRLMDSKDIGAVLVMSDDRLVGIVSERDCARKVIAGEKPPHNTKVREIMTAQVECARPEHTTERCMAIMTEKHIRHLPVMGDQGVLGVISMRDVVRDLVLQQRYTIDQLENYISGGR